MSDIECPYCEKGFDFEGDPPGQDEQIEEECPHCEKSFLATAYWELSFSEEKADCLNGAPHNLRTESKWHSGISVPEIKCRVCGEVTQKREFIKKEL